MLFCATTSEISQHCFYRAVQYNNTATTELYTTYVNIAWLCCRFNRYMLPGKKLAVFVLWV